MFETPLEFLIFLLHKNYALIAIQLSKQQQHPSKTTKKNKVYYLVVSQLASYKQKAKQNVKQSSASYLASEENKTKHLTSMFPKSSLDMLIFE